MDSPNKDMHVSVNECRSEPKTSEETYDPKAIEENSQTTWTPGFWNQFPWIGFGGLMCVLIAVSLAVAILRLSDEQFVASWPSKQYPIQPNVLINVANQVSSLGLVAAIGQGVAIAWWRKALRGGTIDSLHRNHNYGSSLLAVLKAGKHFNIIALAALMTKFAIIDSTLFQKSTRAVLSYKSSYNQSTLTTWIETQWYENMGGFPGDDNRIRAIDARWANVIDAYNSIVANDKVHDNSDLFIGCPSSQECSGHLRATGLTFNCSQTIEDVDYGKDQQIAHESNTTSSFGQFSNSTRQTLNGTGISANYPLWDIDFKTSYATNDKPYASILLDMLYVNSSSKDGTCPGTVTRQHCEIRPALIEYPMTILAKDNKQKSIKTHVQFFNKNVYPFNYALEQEQIDDLNVVDIVDIEEYEGNVSTIGALAFVLNNLFKSSANLTFGSDWDLSMDGARAQSQFYANTSDQIRNECGYTLDLTSLNFTDPFIDLIRQVNTVAFISSLYLTNAPFLTYEQRLAEQLSSQKFDTTVTGWVEIYQTNNAFLIGALAATLVTILCVLPVYYGFWQLGRKMTLGPFEIAAAFNAPMFTQHGTNKRVSNVDELLSEIGKRRVQYGQLVGTPGQLGIAEAHRVARPAAAQNRMSSAELSGRVGVGAALGAVMAASVAGRPGH
jgi:hypothetical protein